MRDTKIIKDDSPTPPAPAGCPGSSPSTVQLGSMLGDVKPPPPDDDGLSVGIIILIVVAVILCVIGIGFFFSYFRHRRKDISKQRKEDLEVCNSLKSPEQKDKCKREALDRANKSRNITDITEVGAATVGFLASR